MAQLIDYEFGCPVLQKWCNDMGILISSYIYFYEEQNI